MKFVFLSVDDNGMAGVRSTRNSSAYIIVSRQYINKLPFPFISPLRTKNNINSTFVFFLIKGLFNSI